MACARQHIRSLLPSSTMVGSVKGVLSPAHMYVHASIRNRYWLLDGQREYAELEANAEVVLWPTE